MANDGDHSGEVEPENVSVSFPDRASLPEPPDVEYTRSTLGKRVSPKSLNLGPGLGGDQRDFDPNLLSQGARGYGVLITAALTLAITLGIFVAIGQWLDHKYNSVGTPWFTILGVIVGIVGGFTSMIRLLMSAGGSGKDLK